MPAIAVTDPLLRAWVARTLPAALGRLVSPEKPADLLVLGPGREGSFPLSSPRRLLLAPGGRTGPWAPGAVSYGPSSRDTLTFSSRWEGSLVLALQREAVTLTGKRLDRQEVPLALEADPLAILAWAGTLLLAGVSPEELAALASGPR